MTFAHDRQRASEHNEMTNMADQMKRWQWLVQVVAIAIAVGGILAKSEMNDQALQRQVTSNGAAIKELNAARIASLEKLAEERQNIADRLARLDERLIAIQNALTAHMTDMRRPNPRATQ